MSYTIDKSNLENNLLFLKLEDDSECFIKLTEIHEGSDVWTFYFIETNNTNKSFEHLCILTKEIVENDLLEKNKVSKLLILIKGDDREDTDKKTEVFISMIKGDWEFKIDQDPETTIEGGSNYINFNTNSIYITKKEKVIESITLNELVMKFCTNCGSENNNFKFCPSCGTNLKQT
jgi:hypothetical protein